VKALTPAVCLLLLSCATATVAQEAADEDYHPTDAQVQQLQQACAVSDAGMAELGEKLSSAIADWRKATRSDGPLAAMRQLDGYFEQVRNHGGLSGKKSIYLLCVEKSVRQFVEAQREKPQVLVASGNSAPLQRSAFGSEDEIWHQGCRQAEADALTTLRSRCGDRVFAEKSSDCAQQTGAVRTYTNQVSGECRVR
jgi:hypothetical protein